MSRKWTTIGAGVLVAITWLPLSARPSQATREGEVTLIGCVELERDYRARKESGRGGVLGSGVGVGNEFVLTNAKPAPGGRRGQPAGTAGAPGSDYSLSGKMEKDFLRHVGRQVEVIAIVEKAGEAMPTLNVSLWHPVGDYCPAK
jgi:hypothetical protein